MVRRQHPAECGGAAGVRVEPPQRVLGLGLWPGGQDPPWATPSLPHWPLPADRALGVRRKSQLRVSRPRAVTRLAASESLQGERTAGPKGRGRWALSWLLPEAWKREGTAGHCCPQDGTSGPISSRSRGFPGVWGVSAAATLTRPGGAGGQLPVGCDEERSVSLESRHYLTALGGHGPGRRAMLLTACGHKPLSEASEAGGGCAGLGSHARLTCPTAWELWRTQSSTPHPSLPVRVWRADGAFSPLLPTEKSARDSPPTLTRFLCSRCGRWRGRRC